MANKTVNVRHKQKIDTASNWTTNNPVLLAGELGFETDTNKFKLGDGTTAWNSLPYAVAGSVLPNNVAYFEDTNFANMSWARIAELAYNEDFANFFSVGDEKTIQLSNGETITLVILGMYHDDLTSGGKAALTIGMKDCLQTAYLMNSEFSSSIIYSNSDMRNNTLPALFMLLPEDLRSVIKYVDKTSIDIENNTQVPVDTSERLFLLSLKEVAGTVPGITPTAYEYEGTQYDYWAGVTASGSRIKTYDDNGTPTDCNWWLRTIVSGGYFDYFTALGAIDWAPAHAIDTRVSFAFCI